MKTQFETDLEELGLCADCREKILSILGHYAPHLFRTRSKRMTDLADQGSEEISREPKPMDHSEIATFAPKEKKDSVWKFRFKKREPK